MIRYFFTLTALSAVLSYGILSLSFPADSTIPKQTSNTELNTSVNTTALTISLTPTLTVTEKSSDVLSSSPSAAQISGTLTLADMETATIVSTPTNKPTQLPTKIPTKIPTKVPTSTPKPSMTPTPTPKPTKTPKPTYPPIPTIAVQKTPRGLDADLLYTMVNSYRTDQGLTPFRKDDTTCAIAYNRSFSVHDEIWVTGNMHAGLTAMNLPYRITENIISFSTEQQAFQWWINDYIHRKQILGDYQYSCTACYGYNCSQVFTSYIPK